MRIHGVECVVVEAQVVGLTNHLFGEVNPTGLSGSAPLSCPPKRNIEISDSPEQNCTAWKSGHASNMHVQITMLKVTFYILALTRTKH